MAVLNQFFFAKCIFYMHEGGKFFSGLFFMDFTPQKRRFFQLGVYCQNCGSNVRIVVQIGYDVVPGCI